MTERSMSIRSLTRGQQEQIQRSKAFGELAERLAAEEYGVDVARGSEWFDLRHPSSGAKTQVKSTSSDIGRDWPASGRFRVWRGQHSSLVASDRAGVAWYVFVLLDQNSGEIRMRRVKPKTVTSIVRDRGGWNESGHEHQGEQHKIPWQELFDE